MISVLTKIIICTYKQLWDGEEDVKKGTKKLAPGCLWRWKVTCTDPFHMVSNRVVGMVCHRRCLNACVFGGKQKGGLHSGLGSNRWDHTHPNHQGPRPESRGTTKHKANIFFFFFFTQVGVSKLFRFGKSPNFHIYDHKWRSDIGLSGTEAPMVWCMTCFREWEKPAG